MKTVKTSPVPFQSTLDDLQGFRSAQMQRLLEAKVDAVISAGDAGPNNLAQFNNYMAGFWFDNEPVQKINATLDLIGGLEAVLTKAQHLYASCPELATIATASPNDLFRHCRLERDPTDPLTLGCTLRAVLNVVPVYPPLSQVNINVTPDTQGTSAWSASKATKGTAALRENLCSAIEGASNKTAVALDMPGLAADLQTIVKNTRNEAIRGMAGGLLLTGKNQQDINAKIINDCWFELLHIDHTVAACHMAVTSLANPGAAKLEVKRWLQTGTGTLPNLFENVLWALGGLCAMSRRMSIYFNLSAQNELDEFGSHFKPLHEVLRNAAVQFAQNDPEHSEFAHWLMRNGKVV